MSAPFDPSLSASGRAPVQAWVVFGDGNRSMIFRLLRRGFRHCFVLLQQVGVWVSVEPLLGGIEVLVHDHPASFDFPGHLARSGFTVVPVGAVSIPPRFSFPFICTCTEVVRRVIGVRHPFLLTPFQLYRFLVSRFGSL